MKLTVLGSGYVGLVTATGLAEMGHQVLCVDIDPARVDTLRAGRVPFFEPGLADLIERNTRGKRLVFAGAIDPPFHGSEVFFIAVGTPPGDEGRADVRAVFEAGDTIARHAKGVSTIAIKSTVPVGTCDALEAAITRINPLLRVASNPEFLKEGSALDDFFKPDRVVIGAAETAVEHRMRELYRPLQLSSERLLVMDRRSAELTKYAANAMLAVRISFMNEMSQLCDRLDADIGAVRRGIGSDVRIGPQFLYAGPGYGGSCFPKDVTALASLAEDVGMTLGVVAEASRANTRQHAYVLQRILSLFPDGVAGKSIAFWGLAFKAETDDVRNSPAGEVALALMQRGATLRAHDPEAAANFARSYAPDAQYFTSEYDALDGADALVVMTEWRHFRNVDFGEIKRRMRTPKVVDARNIWSVFDLAALGFEYRGIGTRVGRQ